MVVTSHQKLGVTFEGVHMSCDLQLDRISYLQLQFNLILRCSFKSPFSLTLSSETLAMYGDPIAFSPLPFRNNPVCFCALLIRFLLRRRFVIWFDYFIYLFFLKEGRNNIHRKIVSSPSAPWIHCACLNGLLLQITDSQTGKGKQRWNTMLEPKFYEWKKASIPLVAQSQSVTNNNSRLTSSKLPTLFSPVHILQLI